MTHCMPCNSRYVQYVCDCVSWSQPPVTTLLLYMGMYILLLYSLCDCAIMGRGWHGRLAFCQVWAVYSARPPSRLGLVNGNAGRAAASGGLETWKRSRSIDYVMTSCLILSPFWVTPLYCSWTSLNSSYCIILCVLVLINTTVLQQCLFVCLSSERLCLHSDCDHQWSDRRNRLSDASHLWPRRWVWLICLHVCLLI